MAGRLLQGLEQGVEGRRRKHVDLVDDVDLEAPTRGGVLDAADDFFANVFHAGATGGIHLDDIGMDALGDSLTLLAGAIGGRCGAAVAQQRLSEQARCGGFARAARPAEQVGVTYFVGLNSVFEGALNVGLAHYLVKGLRTVCAVQSLRHALPLLDINRVGADSAHMVAHCGGMAAARTPFCEEAQSGCVQFVV